MKDPVKAQRRESRVEAERQLDEALEEFFSRERPARDDAHDGRRAGRADALRRSSQSSTFISGATALTSPSATSLPPPRSIWQRRTRGSGLSISWSGKRNFAG